MRLNAISLVQTVKPEVEPVSVQEFTSWLGYGGADMTDTFNRILKSARVWAENYTRKQFITATWAIKLEAFYCYEMEIPKAPLVSVDSIVYVDSNGDEQTLDPSLYVYSTATGLVSPAYNESWPSVQNTLEPITITFKAGYGTDAHDVPEPIRTAIMLKASADWAAIQMAACGKGGACGGHALSSAEQMLYQYRDLRI